MGEDSPQPQPQPPMQAGLSLDPLAQAVSAARRYVREALPALGGQDLLDNAQLAVSELVTNATLHARTPMTVEIVRTDADRIRIMVTDYSASIPHPRAYALTATTGRGLRLVDAVSLAWGVEGLSNGGHGKVVWCEPAPDATVLAPGSEWDDIIADLA